MGYPNDPAEGVAAPDEVLRRLAQPDMLALIDEAIEWAFQGPQMMRYRLVHGLQRIAAKTPPPTTEPVRFEHLSAESNALCEWQPGTGWVTIADGSGFDMLGPCDGRHDNEVIADGFGRWGGDPSTYGASQ